MQNIVFQRRENMKIHHKIYLYVRAKQLKKIVPQNYEEKLKQIINNIDCSLPINFAPIDFPRITLDAATPIYPNKINYFFKASIPIVIIIRTIPAQ